MATRDPDIMLVIIHGNKLHDGDYFWLSLILSKTCLLSTIPPFKIVQPEL